MDRCLFKASRYMLLLTLKVQRFSQLGKKSGWSQFLPGIYLSVDFNKTNLISFERGKIREFKNDKLVYYNLIESK